MAATWAAINVKAPKRIVVALMALVCGMLVAGGDPDYNSGLAWQWPWPMAEQGQARDHRKPPIK